MTVRLWSAVLFGGLASIWLLPAFQHHLGVDWLVLPVLIILAAFYWGTGWLANLLGLSRIRQLIQNAGACERDGMYAEAELSFLHAAAVLDSFLISPLEKRKYTPLLASRLARFYLARADKSEATEAFLTSYLSNYPEDETVAEAWINEMESMGGLRMEHQKLAHKLGAALPKNSSIQIALARFYLLFERTDFPALHTYRQVINSDGPLPPEMVDSLSGLLLTERRADEWSLRVYLMAFERSHSSELLKGIAACLRWTRPTERNRDLLQKARSLLTGIAKEDLIEMTSGFTIPRPLPPVDKVQPKRKIDWQKSVRVWLSAAFSLPTVMAAYFHRQIHAVTKRMRQSRKAGRTLKWLLFGCVALATVLLIFNTVGHLARKDKVDPEVVAAKSAVVSDPFTLQVAAYLKPEHAVKYVASLKKEGLEAYWQEAVSGKKKWYQVRISHFADKASARAFGEKLKSKGIIDDYYVANYNIVK